MPRTSVRIAGSCAPRCIMQASPDPTFSWRAPSVRTMYATFAERYMRNCRHGQWSTAIPAEFEPKEMWEKEHLETRTSSLSCATVVMPSPNTSRCRIEVASWPGATALVRQRFSVAYRSGVVSRIERRAGCSWRRRKWRCTTLYFRDEQTPQDEAYLRNTIDQWARGQSACSPPETTALATWRESLRTRRTPQYEQETPRRRRAGSHSPRTAKQTSPTIAGIYPVRRAGDGDQRPSRGV